MYNAADVYLGATMSEGFGIPIVEAQACGTPVVVTDFSAMPELVRWGYAIPPLDMFWTPQNSWQAWPDWAGIRDALQSLYDSLAHNKSRPTRSDRLKVSAAIHAEYSWDTIVTNQWRPLISRLAGEVVQPKQSTEIVAQPGKQAGRVLSLIQPPAAINNNGMKEQVLA